MGRERAARILEARLEALAAAADRTTPTGDPLLRSRIELARSATQHAIDLGLLTVEEAEELWTHAAQVHPALAPRHRTFAHP